MPTNVAFSAEGAATPALVKRLEKEAGRIQDVERRVEEGREFAFLKVMVRGIPLVSGLQLALEDALAKLPTPKKMQYQILRNVMETVEFVRPVHGLVALYGKEIVPVDALGLEAGRTTEGHRVLSAGPISIKDADSYEQTLRKSGKVEPRVDLRRTMIKAELKRAELELARHVGARPGGRVPVGIRPFVIDTERIEQPAHMFPSTINFELVERALYCSGRSPLLDEVTALVEWPRAYWGRFDERFLELPIECLALTMKKNQKYFPVFDTSAQLQPYFVVIANNDESLAGKEKASIAHNIVTGNERVLRPRLADAHFFYEQDRKSRLEDRVPNLARVVFHNKLGSQQERTRRIALLATAIARQLQANVELSERAALLSKADLLTEMVGEFPELQGFMGRYYALNDGEDEIVANALESHYRPRFSGDRLPQGLVACSVAIADKLDSLIGLFEVGGAPTGEKDPFALRRQALGVIRILVETPLRLDLYELVRLAENGFPKGFVRSSPNLVRRFINDRLKNYLREMGYDTLQVEAVVAQLNGLLYQARGRLKAVKEFAALPEAADLAAANKRVLNIIKKNEEIGFAFGPPQRTLMIEPAEIALMDALDRLTPVADKHFEAEDYEGNLRLLAGIKSDVDRFFEKVMVMVDDEKLRANRAGLLQQLGMLMNRVADISKLAR